MVDHVIEEAAKEGHSEAQWKSLAREVSDLWHITNHKLNQVLEILENNGWDTVRVEDHNPGNWLGRLICNLKVLIRGNPELGLDP